MAATADTTEHKLTHPNQVCKSLSMATYTRPRAGGVFTVSVGERAESECAASADQGLVYARWKRTKMSAAIPRRTCCEYPIRFYTGD
jgi:hypothetical protein